MDVERERERQAKVQARLRKPFALYMPELPVRFTAARLAGVRNAIEIGQRTRLFTTWEAATVWLVMKQMNHELPADFPAVIYKRMSSRRTSKGEILRRINNGKAWWEK